MQTLLKRPNGRNGIPGECKAVGEMKADIYIKEILDTMQKIVGTMPAYKELVFFVK